MILVDTSVWADHLRSTDDGMRQLLNEGKVLGHPFVIGELAMGNLLDREVTIRDLQSIPEAIVAEHDEVMRFITDALLFGSGIGYIDAHLLVSAQLTPETWLWTRDKRLFAAADKLGLVMPNAPRLSH